MNITQLKSPVQLLQAIQISPYRRLLLLGLLFITALGIRLYHINEPPLNFHATRQYRSLIIARGYYFDHSTSVPEWEKQVALFSQHKQGILEPPIMEFFVAVGYRIFGGEHYWIPQLLTSLFWLIGGVFLYLIGTKIADAYTGLFAAAFYLFLPFAIVASRSFQPDSLMVMLILVSLWMILRYHDTPTYSHLIMAALISSLAFIVKPGSVFVIVTTFLALSIFRQGPWQTISGRAFQVFTAITLLPTIVIYLYGTFNGSFLISEAQKTLLPQLWISIFFWRSWITNIGSTVGLIPFVGALLGLLMFRRGVPRAFMAGLWIGYGIFGLVLNYNFATHDYYQLQFVPIVGLSVAPVIALVTGHLIQIHPHWYWRSAVWSILGVGLILSLLDARGRLINSNWEHKVQMQQEIGKHVNHSTKTIFLSGDYGVPLEYHGMLSGSPWPLASDLEWEQLAGLPKLDAQERFNTLFLKDSPQYFIVEDLNEFEQQADLKEFLTQNYPLIAQNEDYKIFALRAK